MRNILTTITLVLFASLSLAENYELPAYFRTAPGLNLRKAPSRSADKLIQLTNEVEVKVLAVDSAGWATLIYNGDTAFAFANYLDYQRPLSLSSKTDSVRTNTIRQIGWLFMAILIGIYCLYIVTRFFVFLYREVISGSRSE